MDIELEDRSREAQPQPQHQPTEATAPAASPSPAVEFEEPLPPVAAAAAAPPAIDIAAAAKRRHDEHRQRTDREAALAQVAGAAAARRWIDLWAVALAACCGQGVGAVTRIERWSTGTVAAVLAAVGCIAVAVWLWRWVRLPAEQVDGLPIPAPEGRSAPGLTTPEQELLRQQRRREDIRRINDLVREMEVRLSCMRFAVVGSGCGVLVGWVVAAFADVVWQLGMGQHGIGGNALLMGSIAGLVGAVLGLCARRQRVAMLPLMITFAATVPSLAAAMGVLIGFHPYCAMSGWLMGVLLALVLARFLAIQAQLAEETSVQRAA
jgi:hypothetical protein